MTKSFRVYRGHAQDHCDLLVELRVEANGETTAVAHFYRGSFEPADVRGWTDPVKTTKNPVETTAHGPDGSSTPLTITIAAGTPGKDGKLKVLFEFDQPLRDVPAEASVVFADAVGQAVTRAA